jgi:hypothetical protein
MPSKEASTLIVVEESNPKEAVVGPKKVSVSVRREKDEKLK